MLIDIERSAMPDILTIQGSFGATKGINGIPYLAIEDVVSGGGGNGDSIVESAAGAGDLGQHVDPGLFLASVADAVLTTAKLDMGTVTTHIDTIIEAAAGGVAGNAWQVILMPGAGAGAGVAYEDAVNKIFTWVFQTGVSDVDDFETVITASVALAVETGGTGATLVTTAGDALYSGGDLSGGIAREYVDDDGRTVTMHYTAASTTVAQMETALTAYAAAAGLIKLQTAGTGASVLQAADAFAAMLLLDGYAVEQHGSGCQSVMRTAAGTYVLTLDYPVASRVRAHATMQFNTAADQFAQLGPWVQATKKQTILIWDKSDGALGDFAYHASNRVNWKLAIKLKN